MWGLETTNRSVLYTAPAAEAERGCAGMPGSRRSFPRSLALVVGNEVTGVAPSALAACDRIVSIPTFGVKNSLNVAVAGSVVAYEAVRAWGALEFAEKGGD